MKIFWIQKLFKEHHAVIFLILLLASRVIFINAQPIFFDSPEYLARLSDPSYFKAIISGHLPLHAGYILLLWPIYHLGIIIRVNPSVLVVIFQIILAVIGIYFYYKFLLIISNKSIGLKSSIIASLLPLFWITNVTIMMETTYIVFFIAGIYFLANFLSSKKKSKPFFLFLGAGLFSFSFLTHLGVILWLPLLLFLGYFMNEKRLKSYSLVILIGIIIATLVSGFFVAEAHNVNITEGIQLFYTSKLEEHAKISFDFHTLLVYLRNFLIPLFRNNTILVVFLAVIGFFSLTHKNKKLLILLFLWIIPTSVANQWWDSVLFGRHALFASFGLVFLVTTFIEKNKTLFGAVIIYLLIVSLPTLYLLKKPIPYLQMAKEAKELPGDGLLIESHFARPQVDNTYRGENIFVDEPGWDKNSLDAQIKDYLKNKKPVFISSQALSEPYALYSGPYLHSLSLSYKNEYVLKPTVENFTLKEYKIVNSDDNLIIYKVASNTPSAYPEIKSLKYHRRRMDFFDPFIQTWFIYQTQHFFQFR